MENPKHENFTHNQLQLSQSIIVDTTNIKYVSDWKEII